MATFRTLKDTTPRDRARALRRDDTEAEARPRNALRARRLGDWRWRRQVPKGLGLRVIRFWNSAVLTNRDGV